MLSDSGRFLIITAQVKISRHLRRGHCFGIQIQHIVSFHVCTLAASPTHICPTSHLLPPTAMVLLLCWPRGIALAPCPRGRGESIRRGITLEPRHGMSDSVVFVSFHFVSVRSFLFSLAEPILFPPTFRLKEQDFSLHCASIN